MHHYLNGKLDPKEQVQLAGLLAFINDVEPTFFNRLAQKYGAETIAALKRAKAPKFFEDFLDYVDERRKLNKPLFYDPDRSRGGKPGNPQFKKVAERIGEWVHGLGIPKGVKPNHAWRHLFKSVARDVRMDREVEGFITGHRPKNSNAGNDYGDRWIKTMSAEIERYPRFKIAALDKSPAPHRRHRRTNAEVAAAKAAREKRKVARSVGAN
jgi:hypothetical protein